MLHLNRRPDDVIFSASNDETSSRTKDTSSSVSGPAAALVEKTNTSLHYERVS